MSRSIRKSPAGGNAGGSEKQDKKIWHSRQRAALRDALAGEDEVLPETKDVSNPWSMSKDGKRWYGEGSWRYGDRIGTFREQKERRKKFKQRREER